MNRFTFKQSSKVEFLALFRGFVRNDIPKLAIMFSLDKASLLKNSELFKRNLTQDKGNRMDKLGILFLTKPLITLPLGKRFSLLFSLLILLLPTASFSQGYIAKSTFVGGNGAEENSKFVVVNGETYILGDSQQTGPTDSYPYTVGSPFAGGGTDLVMTKLDTAGKIVWSRFLGGTNDEYPKDLQVVDGSVFVVGTSASANYPVTNGSTNAVGNSRGVYSKLNAVTGALEFSTYIGTPDQTPVNVAVESGSVYIVSNQNSINNIAITKYDESTNTLAYNTSYGGAMYEGLPDMGYGREFQVVGNTIYLVGVTNSKDFPVTNGSTLSGASDCFYMKVDASTGIVNFATYFGGSNGAFSTFTDLRVYNGNAYIYGITTDTDFPVTDGSLYQSGAAQYDFLTSFNGTTNTMQFSKYIGANIYNDAKALEVENGIVYLYGHTQGPDYPITAGANSSSGVISTTFTKLDATSGSILYSMVLGPTNNTSVATNMTVLNGDAYLLGQTGATDFPVTNGSTMAGVADYTLTKISSNNTICFSTYVGGSGLETPKQVAVSNGDIYVLDESESASFPVTNTSSYGGNTDYTVTKFTLNPTITASTDVPTPSTQTVCQNGLASKITDAEIILSSSSMPLIYNNGVPSTQNVLGLNYQWQKSDASTGPWVDIAGATQANYTPQVGLTNQYYHRIAKASACSGSTLVSTSSVVSVLVNANTAPSLNVGSVNNTCPGNTTRLGGSPTATANGGATISSYLWTPSGTYTPSNSSPNPSVSPSVSTVYTVLVTDNKGCQQVGQQLVNVYSANAGPDVPSCGGGVVRIGGTPIAGLSGVTYSWTASPADPTMSCTNCAQPSVKPSVPTTYTLTLTIPVTGGGTCSTTDAVVVTPIHGPVTANFAGPDVVICLGKTSPMGTAPEAGFDYTWAPGNYVTDNHVALTTFQPGSLSMPLPNPINYFLTATKSGCVFVDSMKAAVTEARAGVDGCGPRYIGQLDRTPNIAESYTWAKISGPGNFSGATNLPIVPVTASVGGPTVYQLAVAYNGTICFDTVTVPECGCVVDVAVEAPFTCPSYGLNTGNVKLTASAADIYSKDPTIFTYSWSPSAGLSSATGAEVSLTDNVSRTYTVTMNSPFDTSFHCIRTIAVNNPTWTLPVFTAKDISTCPATSVNIGQSTVAGYAYKWKDLTNKLNSTSISNPLATVSSSASFPVIVTDILSGCTTKDTASVTIAGFPDNIAGDDITVCGSTNVQLGKGAVANVNYIWTPATTYVPNNISANPTVTVATTTTFHLVATNTVTGCVVNDDVVVTVNPSVAPFTFTGQTFCPSTPGALTLPAGPTGMASYSWTPSNLVQNPTSNGPTATTLNPRPSSATTYTLTATNASGCSAAASVLFTPSVVIPNAGNSSLICKGGTAQLGGANLGGTYSWTANPISALSDLSSTTLSNPVFTPSTTGTFVFKVSRTDPGGCITQSSVTITVEEFTLPIMASPTVCQNACVQIGTTAVLGAQYIWTPSTGLSDASIANPLACVGTTNTTYTLTGIGLNGCVATQKVIVGVNPLPAPTVTVPSVSSCLLNGSATFTPSVTPAGTYNYLWSPNDGTLSSIYAANPTTNFTGVGSKDFSVTVTNATTGCSTTATTNLTVNLCPILPCSVTAPTAPDTVYNVCPLTKVDLTAVSAAITPSVSGDTFEWHVANSSTSALVTSPNSVGAGTYYLFEKNSTDCYSTGVPVNVAIQVCCPTRICLPVTVSRTH